MSFLNGWNTRTTERQKLQHAYLLITIAVIFTAGLISLFNADVGHTAVKIAAFTIAAFFTNAVIWNLLKGGLIEKLPSRPRRK